MYWESQLTGIKFGDDEKNEWGFLDTYAKFDSGVQCVYVPQVDYDFYAGLILNDSTGWFNDSKEGPTVSCDDKDLMPTVKFMFRGSDGKDYWTQWLPEDYMIENGDT